MTLNFQYFLELIFVSVTDYISNHCDLYQRDYRYAFDLVIYNTYQEIKVVVIDIGIYQSSRFVLNKIKYEYIDDPV